MGLAALLLTPVLVAESRRKGAERQFDALGAVTVTAALVALVYGISEAPDAGWGSLQTVGLLVAAGVLGASFVGWEMRVRDPLMPLRILRLRLVSAANVVGFLVGAGMFANFFVLTLYLQQVLGYSALQAGAAFLATAGTAVAMAGLAQALVTRIGAKPVMLVGLVLLLGATLWYVRLPVDGSYVSDLLPAFIAYGIGIPFAFIPVTVAALGGVEEGDAGLGSGMINTSQQIGGALGVAVIATIATSHAESLLGDGVSVPVAWTEAYQRGFVFISLFTVAAVIAASLFIRREEVSAEVAADAAAA